MEPGLPRNVKLSNCTETSVTLEWEKPYGEVPATHYVVHYLDSAYEIKTEPITTTKCEITGLNYTKKYEIYVVAYKDNDPSIPSESIDTEACSNLCE